MKLNQTELFKQNLRKKLINWTNCIKMKQKVFMKEKKKLVKYNYSSLIVVWIFEYWILFPVWIFEHWILFPVSLKKHVKNVLKGIVKIISSDPLFRVQTRFTTVYRTNQKEDIIVFSVLKRSIFSLHKSKRHPSREKQLNIIKFQIEKQG